MKIYLLITFCFFCRLLVNAQPGALDLSFDAGLAPYADIRAIAVQSDGKIIIGGGLLDSNTIHTKHIARLHPDGSPDTTFQIGSGFSWVIRAIAIQSDGKILVGGLFFSYNGISATRIARLNQDGTMDTTFHSGAGFNDIVEVIELQSDGKILVGGVFTSYDNNIATNHICRLNTDGSADTTFHPGYGPNRTVEAILPFPDGSMMIGGDFQTYNSSFIFRLAHVHADGALDSNFTSIPGPNKTVADLSFQSTGQIIAVGAFDNYDLQPDIRGIVRLNLDGTSDVFFNGTGSGPNFLICDVQVLGNDNMLISGWFTTYNGFPAGHITRLFANGAIDTTFNHSGIGANANICPITLQADGKILIGGDFAYYNGVLRRGVARLYNCNTPPPDPISGDDSTLCPGEVHVYSVLPDAERYQWTLPAGWSGSSDSDSITVISNGQGGVISVRAFSDSCGYSAPQTKAIYRNQPPEQPICLVTVDEQSTHNILIWEKTATNLVDSFFIYRETATNVYTKIASVPYDSLSEYHDSTANPNSTSYRYKMSALDTCGVETAKSIPHRTIHLQNLGSGNFQWTFYEIGNSPDSVISYNIYRDDLGVGNFIFLASIPGNNSPTFTDSNYDDYPNSNYVVDANWRISCTPQRGTINTTRSNIRKINVIDTPVVIGVETTMLESIVVYPNPSEDEIMLRFPTSIKITDIRLFNSLGKIVWSKMDLSENLNTIQTGILPKGIYVLAVETKTGCVKKKVIIQ